MPRGATCSPDGDTTRPVTQKRYTGEDSKTEKDRERERFRGGGKKEEVEEEEKKKREVG